jgi:hypothetical protein
LSTTTFAPPDETAQQGLIVRPIKICGDAHLVAIAAEVVRALAARIERRTPSAALVAGSRALDFHHIRSQIAKNHRGEWTGEHTGKVEYSNTI